MKILVLGAGGQLAKELDFLSNSIPQHRFIFKRSDQVDITNFESVSLCLKAERPDVVINAAAYTAVDKAESEVDLAFAVNAEGVKNIALACKEFSTFLFHVSTDFVFSGESFLPYGTEAEVNPMSVYGQSKAKGEGYVLDLLPNDSCVVRTSWLYSSHSPCFVSTMLRLMNERDEISVVSDQIGTPTAVSSLAEWFVYAAEFRPTGIRHVSDSGVASWYDFSCAIYCIGKQIGLLTNECIINPIPTAAYPTPAKRPHYSVLDTSASFEMESAPKKLHWQIRLNETINKIGSI